MWYAPGKRVEIMRGNMVISLCLITVLAGTHGVVAMTQDTTHHVIDFVDLPMDLVGKDPDPDKDRESAWYIEFQETWDISPDRSGMLKTVEKYTLRDRNAPLSSTDTLQLRFITLIRQLPVAKGTMRLRNISYEFMLLDPHVMESGNNAFPEPDSMDSRSRKLQRDLISLIQSRTPSGNRFDYQEQLLSVHFHEDWAIDPVTNEFIKKVHGITPVMWQRRETTTGEPVNDAETGLPVYYKIQLNRIDLRNP